MEGIDVEKKKLDIERRNGFKSILENGEREGALAFWEEKSKGRKKKKTLLGRKGAFWKIWRGATTFL